MTCEQFPREATSLSSVAPPDAELSPAVRELAESFRRRLGALDPRQVAIWREMTPAQKLRLAFQAWYLARKIVWTTEHQWHPDLTDAELSRRMWKRLHGSEIPYDPTAQSG